MSNYSYLLGCDFGIRDECAYSVVATRDNDRTVYVVESWKESGRSPTEMAEIIHELSGRYDFVKIWGDQGGMGLAFIEEMRKRFSIPIEPAVKANKLGFISLMNGAFERGEIQIIRGNNEQLIRELEELPWADDLHQKEAPGFPNHCTDSLLYVWRGATAYHNLPKDPVPDPGTTEYYDHLDKEYERQAEEKYSHNAKLEWWQK